MIQMDHFASHGVQKRSLAGGIRARANCESMAPRPLSATLSRRSSVAGIAPRHCLDAPRVRGAPHIIPTRRFEQPLVHLMNARSKSIGRGNTIVEFFSAATSVRVWR